MSRNIYFAACLLIITIIAGCVSQTKILIASYSGPREHKKVEMMISSGDNTDTGKYLTLSIDPDVGGVNSLSSNTGIATMLIDDIKERLTETNFISIHPIFDPEDNGLKISVASYQYLQTSNNIKANLRVNFILSRGVTEFFSKSYDASEVRFSKSGQGLPSKELIEGLMTKKCTTLFIRDISPTKILQLREFKSFPSKIAYVAEFAKVKNYEAGIKAMNEYNGNKDVAFHYNLAILYEALASDREDIKYLTEANQHYDLAMAGGGGNDKLIVKSKARFDNYYRLFSKIENQTFQNLGRQKELQEEYGTE